MWEERLTYCYPSWTWREVRAGIQAGPEPEAGANTEAMEGCCSLVCFSWFAQPATVSWTHCLSFLKQWPRKRTTGTLIDQSGEDIFLN